VDGPTALNVRYHAINSIPLRGKHWAPWWVHWTISAIDGNQYFHAGFEAKKALLLTVFLTNCQVRM
jgi:hypothetical protein